MYQTKQRRKLFAKLFAVFLHKAALLLKGYVVEAITDQNEKHK